ncbi:biopolymer transporter ExbD [Winogradskyella sp.]|jgi:biopolymer transport protein ExbD|uniref:ExbD/TolR family protein n=1 Tax=Winogradskyella sp. TaxID=1883156 RepID=UPI0025F8A826|nr:biopolymer transporter ExbD [Winogradskyella sp.]MCT4629189.1 biopolymer transporter ExbD [Winogradskyella sp.]
MKSFRRHPATVNAGSMADIAFLLLIFFLVTTTISADKGILRQLPSDCPNIEDCIKDINERNILRINLNSNQEIFIEDKVVKLEDVEQIVKAFVDNNGALDCDYCYGEKLTTSSDHPKEAVISLSHDALTKYYLFISVQDEITKAYYDLRQRYIKEKFNKTPEQITDKEFKIVKQAYPFIVSEVKVKRN